MGQHRTGAAALAPLTGIVFAVLAVIALFISGDRPDADASATEAVEFWTDKEAANNIGSLLEALAAVALLFFAASLWRGLGRGESGGVLPVAALGGGVVAAAGFGVDAAIRVAATGDAGDVDPVVTQTISAIWVSYGTPIVIGLATLIFAAGLSALRTRVLPLWLASVGILISVALFTPIGFFASLAAFLWIVVVSAVLWRHEAAGAAAPVGQA